MKPIIKDIMKNLQNHPKRLFHVISVALTASAIAKHHGLNVEEAYLAGMMHDYSKHENIEFHKKWLSKELINEYSDSTYLYHALSAANYFKDKYNISDNLYQAVANHVYGMPNMDKLTQVLFISDSIYFNNFYLYTKALKNLDNATFLVCEDNIKKIVKRGLVVAKEQKLTYNYYKGVRI